MYNSNKKIENKSLAVLRKDLDDYLKSHYFIYVKALKRKVFLDKLPNAIIHRKSTRKKRLQCFLVACDILKYERNYKEKINGKHEREFEIKGNSVDEMIVGIHIREEITDKGKNKKLFFVLCFFPKK